MKRFIYVCCLLGLALPAVTAAQEVIDEWSEEENYEAYFGESTDESDEPGPADLHEALEQRRGYRIGGQGKYAAQAPRGTSQVHTVVEGDTLWDISAKYYGDPWQWPKLWSYNPEITNPHWIYPLDKVRLSSDALSAEEALASATGESGGQPGARAVVVPRHMMTPGTIFVREEGFIGRDALKAAGKLVASRSPKALLSTTDEVYIEFEDGGDIRAGQEYAIFRELKPIERDPAAKGVVVRVFGTVTVRSYDRDKKLARGVVSEALGTIERGCSVGKVERRFAVVAPKRNDANAVAHIIAALRPHIHMSHLDLVFLDVGANAGVKPGNRFFVVRRGDPYLDVVSRKPKKQMGVMPVPSYDPQRFPKEVVAELRVVRVMKESTAALVTRSDVDLQYGDVAEMRVGF